MNENIDLTKILKDCPKDTVFYSSIYGNVLVEIITDPAAEYPIYIYKTNHGHKVYVDNLTKEGKYNAQYGEEPTLFPSKDQRDWNKRKCHKPKFDPKTLKVFDRVLARDDDDREWIALLFSHINTKGKVIVAGCVWAQVIPYNKDTKHLTGTSDEAPEYYRYWED